jgi:hypothetical protein
MTYDIVERLLHWYTVFPCDADKPEGSLYIEAANEIASLRAEVARLEAYIAPADDALISLSTLLIACDEMQESDIQEGDGDSPEDFRLSTDNIVRVVERALAERDALCADVARLTGAVGTMSTLLSETEAQLAEAVARSDSAFAVGVEAAAMTAFHVCTETRHVTLGRKVEAAIRALASVKGDARITREQPNPAECLEEIDIADAHAIIWGYNEDQTTASAEGDTDDRT